jgi:histidinol-phosphate/aromatic aminotransferase/cobyric acid decarboxylase-like protein
MTANELADALEQRNVNYTYDGFYNKQAATMLRQQAEEIEELKERLEETRQLYIKQLALQRLSDIGQEIEDRDSAIYATGYWNGIAKGKEND